ncbi:MAG: nicotinate phosphoribosyltransferase [Planctomycetes bacterium]|nr:nicotinate phosphoribosyltransferase [Planctomycetota bacterium]
MWLMQGTPALFTDFYELTMAQVYFAKGMRETASFEVFVRHLPEHWGFSVMAGLPEVQSYLQEFRFVAEDVAYLRSTGRFEADFLEHLAGLKLDVKIRALPEGTVFFPNEPILEVSGPILQAQLLESYLLNILGFSIIEATVAARISIAAQGIPAVDFGLRRAQGPISSIRAARGGQIAGFAATSNVFAARLLGLPPSGTMAHSFIEAHESEEQAFRDFAELHRENAILLVDTYDSVEGIKTAAQVARGFLERGIRLRGIRLDSGDLVTLSRFARTRFREQGLEFLRIVASGDLDEFKVADLLAAGAEIDGFGIGTRFAVSQHAPAIGIVYKLAQYGDRQVYKTSPEKATLPGRKTIVRMRERDFVKPFDPQAHDLLQHVEATDPMPVVRQRLADEMSRLPDAVKALRNPACYPVEFA